MSSNNLTRVNKDDIETIRNIIFEYMKKNESITNRLLREIANISYDQAIYVFNELLKANDIEKFGVSSGTHYKLKIKK